MSSTTTFNVALPQGAPPKIFLDGTGRRGTIAFTVTNNKPVGVKASARVEAIDSTPQAWVGLGSDSNEWNLKPNETIQVTVAVMVDALPKEKMECSFRLVVANAANPQVEYTQSQPVAFTVGRVPPPPPIRWMWWLIGAAAAALIAVVVFILLTRKATVPELTAHTLADARASLKAAGLQETEDIDVGTVPDAVTLVVQDQDLKPGEKVARGTKLKLSLLKSLTLPTNGMVDFQKLANPSAGVESNDLQLAPPKPKASTVLKILGNAKIAYIPIAGSDEAGIASVATFLGDEQALVPAKVLVRGSGIVAAGTNQLFAGTIPFVAALGNDGRLDPSLGGTGWYVASEWSSGKLQCEILGSLELSNSTVVCIKRFSLEQPNARPQLALLNIPTTTEGAKAVSWKYPTAGAAQPVEVLDRGAATPDGMFILAGRQLASAPGKQGAFQLAQFTADGKLDPSFNGGHAVVEPGAFRCESMAVTSDGSIFVVGSSADGQYHLERFTKTGTRDSSIGDVPVSPQSSAKVESAGVTVLADRELLIWGKISAGENFVLRLSTDGKTRSTLPLPATFQVQQGGTAFGFAGAVGRYGGGAILLGGRFTNKSDLNQFEICVAAYTADGKLDTSFGSGGSMVLPAKSGFALVPAAGKDGKILIAGVSSLGCTVTRLNPDGKLDADFAKPYQFSDVFAGKADLALSSAPLALTSLPAKSWIYVKTNTGKHVLMRLEQAFDKTSTSAQFSYMTW